MSTPAASDGSVDRGIAAMAWERTGALRAGIIAGAVFGAAFGGVGGRIVMRVIALIDTSTDGAQTDFATVGEITLGGTFTLLVLTTIAGLNGGLIYAAVRQWLPWSHAARGAFFGLLMMFGPGVIGLGEVDLQIFEPALPIFAMFVALIVLYGVAVALLTDRLHPEPVVRRGPRVELAARSLVGLAAVGICAMVVLVTYNIHDKAGSCLSADDYGSCAVHASER